MIGFQTKSSTYYVDQYNKTISGGYFGEKKEKFVHMQAMIGNNAHIELADGRVVNTSIVEKYV